MNRRYRSGWWWSQPWVPTAAGNLTVEPRREDRLNRDVERARVTVGERGGTSLGAQEWVLVGGRIIEIQRHPTQKTLWDPAGTPWEW